MILVDTSAWVELLRATERPADRTLTRLLGEDADIVTTDVVAMELLAGAQSQLELHRVRSHLRAFPRLHVDGPDDFEAAASIYRTCRSQGETPRRLNDCLVAMVALRAEIPILHSDRDFDVIARHTALEVYPLDR